MAVVRPNNVQDFLNHSTNEKAGAFLRGWKKEGKLEHYLHMKHPPICVWGHPFPSLVPVTDKQTNDTVNHVWARTYGCPETEQTLKTQYFRNGDSSRQNSPRECGVCRLIEWVYQGLLAKRILLETPIFRIAGDVESEACTICAGGLANQLKGDKLSAETKKRVLAAGVNLDWKAVKQQAVVAKPQYIVVLVSASEPAKGPQIVTVTGGLGDKIKDAISEEMKKAAKPAQMRRASREEQIEAASARDPFTHPYMFEWVYDKSATDPHKFYNVIAHVDVKPDDFVLEQISGPAIALDNLLVPMKQASMRARMERACLLTGKDEPPWDDLFGMDAAASVEDESAVEDPDMEFPVGGEAQKPACVPEIRTTAPKRTPEELVAGIAEDDLYGCEVCGKGSPTATECVWCGAKYDDLGNLIKAATPPEPPKQMRSRSDAAKSTKPRF